MRKLFFTLFLIIIPVLLSAQNRPYRVGTTTAGFLEIGYGNAGLAMGDAYVSLAEDISSIYWNPAGLAYMKHSEVQFSLQPWIVDINTSFSGAGLIIPGIGTVAMGLIYTDYGDMDVTTVMEQDGTGEIFSSSDYALSLSYARKITDWFAFGVSGKYIGSKIWHMKASAMAMDVGVRVNTAFFSPTNDRNDGMRIAMSIANYGSRMQYDGIDLLYPIDILPDQDGNYSEVSGKFNPNEWELPLIFRLGFALNAIKTSMHRVTFAFDALHPNNNAESVNLGTEYELNTPKTGKFFLRAGYKALFLPDSEHGLTLGGGIQKYFVNSVSIKMDYAYRDIGLLGKVHSYSIGFTF